MTFLPVVARELRVAARRSSTYRTRVWAVFLAILVFGWLSLKYAQLGVPASQQGGRLFLNLSGFAFAYCLLIGARMTADCLSEEKRAGTLGLLFLTDLKGYDIVLGKLVANSLNAFYGLVTIIPLLAIPIQLGGVGGLQFVKMALVLLNTMFFSLAMGISVSAISRDERKAMFAAVLGILLVAGLPLLVAYGLVTNFPDIFADAETIWPVLALSPVYGLGWLLLSNGLLPPPVRPPDLSFWASLVTTHLLAWWFLLLASRALPRIWQSEAPRHWLARLQDRIEQWGYGSARQRAAHRDRLLDVNPFLWLASRDRWKPWYVWLLLLAMVVSWSIAYRDYGQMMFDVDTLIPALFILNTFLKIWLTSEACARVVADRRAGALELLLSTPLTTAQIIRGQWLALRRQFAKPLLVALVLEYWAMRHIWAPLPILAGLTILVLDLITLGWVSLWLGLQARNTGRAILTAVALILVVPWLVYGAFLMVLQTFFYQFSMPNSAAEFGFRVFLWFALGVTTDLLLGFLWARNRLRHDFREAALESAHTRARE